MSSSQVLTPDATPGYVYFVQEGGRGAIKIGHTVDIERRQRTLQTGNSRGLHLLATVPGSVEDEKAYHTRFRHLRLRGEFFAPANELMEYLLTLGPLDDLLSLTVRASCGHDTQAFARINSDLDRYRGEECTYCRNNKPQTYEVLPVWVKWGATKGPPVRLEARRSDHAAITACRDNPWQVVKVTKLRNLKVELYNADGLLVSYDPSTKKYVPRRSLTREEHGDD